MVARAYDPWSLRQQRITRFVNNEDELREAIITLSGVGSSFNRLKGGGTIIITGPMSISKTITIPVSCPGLVITSASRFPITSYASPVFDVRAEYCTIKDLLVVAASSGFVPLLFVTSHDPAVSGRSCVGLRVLGNVVFTRSLFQDLSAGQTSFAHIEGNRLGQPDGTLPTNDGILIDSVEAIVANNELVPGAGGRGVAVTANGGSCRIVGNYLAGRQINTSASSGGNTIDGNSAAGTKTLAATDIDNDAKPSGAGATNQVALWSGASSLAGIAAVNSAVLTTDGAGVPSWTTQAALLTGRLIRSPQVLTAGTSYAKPAGCNRIVVELVGGGGGGGGAPTAASSAAVGGGGAGGAYAQKSYDVSALAGPFTYAIGGQGGGGNTGNGSAGGSTTFTDGTTLVTAKGGGGGIGGAAGTVAAFTAGGAPVVATNGDVNGAGAPGGYGSRPSGTVAASGQGGASAWGGGGACLVAQGVGNGGTGVGGGGGGGCCINGGAAVSGGAGASGAIRIWEFT